MTPTSEPFRIAIVPGVTITKWSTAWKERQRRPLAVSPITEDEQTAVIHAGTADVSFVRLPIDTDGLSVISLYTEVAVVVVPKEHPIALFESITMGELAGESLRTEAAEDAVEIVAAGAGILIAPQSVARQYGRKDVVAVPITDAPTTEIAIVWLAAETSEEIEDFVGIVRGRRAGSSRGRQEPPVAPTAAPKKAATARRQGGGGPRSGGKAKAVPKKKRPPKSQARGRKKTGRG